MDHFDTPIQIEAPLVFSTPLQNSMHSSRKASWDTPIPPPSIRIQPTNDDVFDDVNINTNSRASTPCDKATTWDSLDNIAALGLSFNANDTPDRDTPQRERFALEDDESTGNKSLPLESERPFNKWMKHIQRKATQRRKTVSCDMDDSVIEWQTFDSPAPDNSQRHKKSSSGSSLGFVTAVKEASISLASLSIAPRSRRTGASSRQHRTDRSSKASNVGRLSEDSSYIARSIIIDQGVTSRLIQRRRVLEEIINTEESYLADIKFLMNVSRAMDSIRRAILSV
jgi:hypothetical protein